MFEAVEFVEVSDRADPVERLVGEFGSETEAVETVRTANLVDRPQERRHVGRIHRRLKNGQGIRPRYHLRPIGRSLIGETGLRYCGALSRLSYSFPSGEGVCHSG